MKISEVILEHVKIPLREPFRISNGEVTVKDAIIVRLKTDAGVGIGEASPMGGTFYSAETPESSWAALVERLIPLAFAAENIEPWTFHSFLAEVEGDAFAKAGLEGAVWDVAARQRQQPLHQLLGGTKRAIPSGVAIGLYDTVEELLERVNRFVTAGYCRVKIKITAGQDLELVKAVRAAHRELPLMVDANGAYGLEDLPLMHELDRFQLMMIEQPFGRAALGEMAELQRNIKTPVCADESAENPHALEEIIRLEAARIINIKVQRVGGLAVARAMHDRACRAGLPCWLGTMPELGLASAQGLHLATLDGFRYPTDVEASSRWFVADIIDPEIEVSSSGWIRIPDGPATGYDLNEETVERFLVRREVLKN